MDDAPAAVGKLELILSIIRNEQFLIKQKRGCERSPVKTKGHITERDSGYVPFVV